MMVEHPHRRAKSAMVTLRRLNRADAASSGTERDASIYGGTHQSEGTRRHLAFGRTGRIPRSPSSRREAVYRESELAPATDRPGGDKSGRASAPPQAGTWRRLTLSRPVDRVKARIAQGHLSRTLSAERIGSSGGPSLRPTPDDGESPTVATIAGP